MEQEKPHTHNTRVAFVLFFIARHCEQRVSFYALSLTVCQLSDNHNRDPEIHQPHNNAHPERKILLRVHTQVKKSTIVSLVLDSCE
jgi:hypothetical protein